MVGFLDIAGLIGSVKTVGFPIVMAVYLLVRMEKRIEGLEASLEKVIDQTKSRDKHGE
ncbi:YvrJ family protein [Pseudalkalibacillus caeni]|uniref:YvrJ family protein n=1 Tax=Exobacillus caeni TaxID=2574798 RepID=A0A5R9F739_9BACL|nr:YvrJ family protein [Pseudalkalibacillus caeni]TLS36653.1 YvrJ family protein [Pseudalkalibacillus caeni]